MKPIVVDSEAERELTDSVEFYERRRANLGLEFEEAAREAVRTIQAAPGRHVIRQDGTRRYVLDRFPFVIHYLDLPDCIWIIAFAHTSRLPDYWKPRLESEP